MIVPSCAIYRDVAALSSRLIAMLCRSRKLETILISPFYIFMSITKHAVPSSYAIDRSLFRGSLRIWDDARALGSGRRLNLGLQSEAGRLTERILTNQIKV